MHIDYELIFGMDKQMHFVGYVVISVLSGIFMLLLSEKHSVKRRLGYLWITLVIIGILEEYRQFWLPDRSAEFLDALANMFGVTVGLLLPILYAIKIKYSRKFASGRYTIYSFTIIALLIGLSIINERPFILFEEPYIAKFTNIVAFIGL
ncbi:VanZ family protein [Ureibacillus aquaedulcis]|uniref:VanZ family protein n=1 Tax=Ureibacillus aquaedulcis TaxID=3058421 RepID=A0ABT8GUN4_9BACL|nr:VanZ family protein [Ureibacillus sp. BA0131]MDN4495133.1 VanZ family protein [Ureibacillus sp. BA0131]